MHVRCTATEHALLHAGPRGQSLALRSLAAAGAAIISSLTSPPSREPLWRGRRAQLHRHGDETRRPCSLVSSPAVDIVRWCRFLTPQPSARTLCSRIFIHGEIEIGYDADSVDVTWLVQDALDRDALVVKTVAGCQVPKRLPPRAAEHQKDDLLDVRLRAGAEVVLRPPSAVLGLIPLAGQLPFVDHGVLDSAAERLRELGNLMTVDGGVLPHGDFYPGNVLIHDNHACAIRRMADADLLPSGDYPRLLTCGLPQPCPGQRFHARRLPLRPTEYPEGGFSCGATRQVVAKNHMASPNEPGPRPRARGMRLRRRRPH
jgi:hypothetical protein